MLSLRLQDVAPDRDYRAAYVALQARLGGGTLHDHDFYEVMWVLAGRGTHRVSGQALPLAVGDLVLVRPGDRHRVEVAAQKRLDFVNVAFRAGLWRAFLALAGQTPAARSWDAGDTPPAVHVEEPDRTSFNAEVDRLLQAYDGPGSQLELLRYLGAVVGLLAPERRRPPIGSGAGEPDWLRQAARGMHEPENLRIGFSRFVSLCGVSEGHLARALRRYRGQTPVEFITELRLRRAAMLLESTSAPIGEVALESGFDNLSYFHRRFRQRFGSTPRAFRLSVRRQIAP